MRQFIHSYDLAKLLLWVLRDYDSVEPIILSVGEEDEVSIKQVVEWIAEAFDWKEGIVWDTEKADGQFKKTASNKKLMDLLPGNKYDFIPLQQGIKDTVQWFIDNHDIARL
eukprot:UN03829